jgi:hypothetical protein
MVAIPPCPKSQLTTGPTLLPLTRRARQCPRTEPTGHDQLTFVAPPLVNLRRSFAARAFIETEPSGVTAREAVSLLAH